MCVYVSKFLTVQFSIHNLNVKCRIILSLFSVLIYIVKSERKGLLLLESFGFNIEYFIIVIKTCFEMLKSSEHEKLRRFQMINPPIFKMVQKLNQLTPISF